MAMMLSRSLVLLMALACAACAPIPHVVTMSPEINGSLMRDGAPVADHEVRVAWGPAASPCDTTIVAARTGQDGKFTLPRQTQFRFLYAPLVAPLSVREFNVCTATTDEKPLLFKGIVRLYGAGPMTLACTLKEPKPGHALRTLADERCDARGG